VARLDRVVGVLLDVMPGGRNQLVEHRGYWRTATTITSGGKRNPVSADLGGSHGRRRVDDFIA
jgi:hypothetical protein